jgi:hypothetical protein
MPDDLYDSDILVWSEHQADLLRRLGRGEGVNGVDWAHVAEEIEDVGLSELHAVESFLNLMLVHLLKIRLWPNSEAVEHWRGEIVAFQRNAKRRFAPSMRQRIDLAKLYDDAVEQISASSQHRGSSQDWPATCPFNVDELLGAKWQTLEACITANATVPEPPTPAA